MPRLEASSRTAILEPYITDWLSPELSITDGMNGARRTPSGPFAPVHEDYASGAGDRQEDQDAVGRHEQKLMVFLLTDCPAVRRWRLDIAYIVRGIIERDHGSAGIDRVNTLGYLFTPDINLANKA